MMCEYLTCFLLHSWASVKFPIELAPHNNISYALAFACTWTKLSLLYEWQVACDLDQFPMMARRPASRDGKMTSKK